MGILVRSATHHDWETAELASDSDAPRWLGASLFGLATVLASLTSWATRPLVDPDTWWHLQIGNKFRGSWSIASPGYFSEFATEPWTARDWLPQMLASKFEDLFGLGGVSWLAGAAYLACVSALWFGSRAVAGPLPSIIATAVGTAALTIGLTPRPQVVSFFMLSVFVGAWLRSSLDLRPRWYLIPLTALWACCHGMWIVGVILGFAMVLGIALDRNATRQIVTRMLAIPVAGVLVPILTPAGVGTLLAAVEPRNSRQYITEWQPTSFLNPQAALVAVAIVVVLIAAIRRGHLSWTQILLLLMTAGWTALYTRTVALGAVMITPLLATTLHMWMPDAAKKVKATERWIVGVLVICCLAALAVAVKTSPRISEELPLTLDQKLAALPEGEVVLNDYKLGGWLEWRHPHVTVVIDGNTPAYSDQHFESYLRAMNLAPGWYGFVETAQANYALVGRSSTIAEGLRLKGWHRAAQDEQYVLLFHPTSAIF